MAWWSKITKGQLAAASLIAAGLGGFVYWAYQKYQFNSRELKQEKKQEEQSLISASKQFSIQDQIHKLKQSIDIKNPSLQDIKKILLVLANYVKNKTLALSNEFKMERRSRFPHEQRLENIGEYLKYSSDGLMKLQQTIMDLQNEQTQLMGSLGIDQNKFKQYEAQISPFMQGLLYDSSITLQEVKLSINIKTEYLQIHGQKIIGTLIQLSSALSLQEKQFIPLFLNIIISDEAFQNQPELDKEEFDMAYEKYQAQANAELIKLERVLIPLMGKLQTALMGDQMGGLGGFGGVGSYPSEYEQLGQIGDYGGMIRNEEMMKQQLQMMRQADPQGYSQMMAMVQAQNH